MPGRKHGPSIKNAKTYEALRRQGMPKSMAAAISNKAVTKAGRSAMAKRAAATRKKRSGR